MTVKEMKQAIKKLPDDAECYFSIWEHDGEHKFMTNKNVGKIEIGANKQKFVRLVWVDFCAAHQLREIDGKLSF